MPHVLEGKAASRRRAALVVSLFLIELLYIPINRTVAGGVVLATALDELIPFWPLWAYPYLLSIPWWVACYLWAALRMDDDRFEALMVATAAVVLTSYAVYIVFPTYVLRPPVLEDGAKTAAIRLIYHNDRVNNAFPSGHTYTTILILLSFWGWRPRLRWALLAIAVTVLLSTLFTAQHVVADIAGGIVWAWLGHRLGLWWVRRRARS